MTIERPRDTEDQGHDAEPSSRGREALTRVLNGEGGSRASGAYEVVYGEMRMIASRVLGEAGGPMTGVVGETSGGPGGGVGLGGLASKSANLTLLVHEAWIKLQRTNRWQSRAHFFGSASNAMRQVLVDEARRRRAIKRRANHTGIDPDSISCDGPDPVGAVLAVDEAISLLAVQDARAARVAEMKLFGDIDTATIAAFLDVNERTVQRDWRFAQAWLADALRRA